MTVDAYIRVRLQYTDASNDCLVGPTVSRKWYNFQTPAFSLDAVYSSEGFVEEMKSRPTQGGGLGTSKRQRKQHGRKRSSKHFLGPDESRENSSNATCRGHGQADFPTPSRDTSDATVLKASQRSITIVGTSARSWVSGSRAGVPDQKKLEKQVNFARSQSQSWKRVHNRSRLRRLLVWFVLGPNPHKMSSLYWHLKLLDCTRSGVTPPYHDFQRGTIEQGKRVKRVQPRL